MLKKYIVDLLQDNPLNGISTYNDALTLSTGAISRKIKKLVLTGEEDISYYAVTQGSLFRRVTDGSIGQQIYNNALCSHYVVTTVAERADNTVSGNASTNNTNIDFIDNRYNSVADFKNYLRQQYAAGTPVTVWFILANETTEQITVPTGLSGTVDGYTTQTGTPTPTAPIYPTANTVTMWANYTPSRYNGIAFVTATGQPEQYNGGWS